MRVMAIALVALCIAGAGLAQEAGPPQGAWPQWQEQPSARDFARNYPEEALLSRQPGTAHLCCVPRADGRLDCRVALEAPREAGFGRGALRISRQFRLTDASLAALQSEPDARLHIPIIYRPSQISPEAEQAFARIREETHGICAVPGSDPGPIQEPIVVTVGR